MGAQPSSEAKRDYGELVQLDMGYFCHHSTVMITVTMMNN